MAVLGIVGAAVLVPFALGSLQTRLGNASVLAEDQEREAFKRAAAMMLADHPGGVGPNHYVLFIANTQGYSERAGVIPAASSRSTNVHNVYWLVAAESGYFGLITFVLFLAQPPLSAFWLGWFHRNSTDMER